MLLHFTKANPPAYTEGQVQMGSSVQREECRNVSWESGPGHFYGHKRSKPSLNAKLELKLPVQLTWYIGEHLSGHGHHWVL